MPELPWVKWYPSNWASEPGLRQCDPATRGIWFEALNTMFLWGGGSISGTLTELSVLLLCRPNQLQAAIIELKKFKVADIVEQNRTNDEQNDNIIISCRRTLRTVAIKQLRANAGRSSGNKRRTKGEQTSASASACTSDIKGVQGGNGLSEADKVTKCKSLDRAIARLKELGRVAPRNEKEQAEYLQLKKVEIPKLKTELKITV